ncbi:scoloptoxin SSD14-like [Daphnia carinata]|uniref:scoloptoxin SSD14-like n=1 Tax=Daphnia carinata TaxID=120202 RepID=UPI002869434A|nr:scoloptoxin SSD14-like [Daphnia carinata]
MAFQVSALRLSKQVKSLPLLPVAPRASSVRHSIQSNSSGSQSVPDRRVNMASRAGYELAFAASPTSTPSRLGRYKKVAVSCDGAQCSNVAREILQQGGNAVDAAIAALFCNAVVNPQSAGLGGGCHMTIYDPLTRTAKCLDARETAPLAATENMFEADPSLAKKGGLAVAVPGELAGYWAAHETYGRLPWSQLIQPAVKLAENGVPVNRHLAEVLRCGAESIRKEPSMRSYVDETTGRVLQVGDTFKLPALADTLKQVGRHGIQVFYDGPIGDKMVEDVRLRGGILTKEDLRQYRAEWVEPVQVELKNNLTLYSHPPPGSGVVTAYIMRLLDGHVGSGAMDGDNPVTYHRIAEAIKHAFGQRTKLSDPRFHPEVNQLAELLISDSFVDETRSKMCDASTWDDPAYYGAACNAPEDHGTSHVSIVDETGMAVAVTSTINLHFGAGFASAQTGIILNNEMADFSLSCSENCYGLPPNFINMVKPGKRPLSSMTPTIVVNSSSGRVRLVIGAAGGIRITTSTVYAMIRNLWFGEDIKEAIDSPRFHHQLFPMTLNYEEGFPKEMVKQLANRGHQTSQENTRGGSVYGISVEQEDDDEFYLYANADYRKGGDVAGF